MREISLGIPRIVLTITDGFSKSASDTKAEANRIKARKINMISVGVAGARISELLTLATTSNDQYYVDDFDKILPIVNDISRTTCRQPVNVVEQDELKQKVSDYF